MANKFSSNNDMQALLDNLSLDDIVRLKAQKEASQRRTCHHTKLEDCSLIPISKSDLPNNVKSKYPEDTVVVCAGRNGCGEIIDLKEYSKNELNNGFFMLRSVLNQMQIVLGAKLEDDDQKQLIDGFVYLDYLEKVVNNVYEEMRKMNSKKNNGSGKKQNKGGIGLTAGMLHS